MSKRIVLPILLSVLFCLPAGAAESRLVRGAGTELPRLVSKTGRTYKLGKKPYPAGTREKWIAEGRALARTPAGILPQGKTLKGAADNRSYLPPIGDQGSEGSCVHWSGTYYTKTANMKRNDASINVNSSANQCSPRFTYNLTNQGQDNGGYGHEPYEIFMRYGVPSLAQKPYVAGQYATLPTTADFIEGLHRRTGSYVWLWDWNPDASQIAELKAWLDAGGIASCGVYAEDSFDAWNPGDAPWVGSTCTIDDINHMVTVCGYGTGYYLIANSWADDWGSNGYIVVSANYFENYFSDILYPIEGTYEPATDYAKLTIRHGTRSDIRELLITANGANVWSNSPLPQDMPIGGGGAFATDSRDNLELAVDLTSAPWLEANNVVTARVKDAVSSVNGTVTVFTVKYEGTEYASTGVPAPVAYNVYTGVWVRLGNSTDTNVSFTASGTTVSEGSGSCTVTVYKTQASGNVSGQIALSGTATADAGADYTISDTNFTLNAATTSATFTVTINDDEDEESAETIVLTLANVTGGIPLAPDVFTLTINPSDLTGGSVLISQYTETETGTTPKGIEIWNASASDLTFDGGTHLLDVKVGVNGGAPASVLTVNSGTLAAGDVWVIGTSNMTPDVEEPFTFNGDDAIVLELGGVVQDVVGTPGVDPGASWSGGGVSTADQNIQLKAGTTFGDPDGWTDPSERFEYVSAGSILTGFGEPPGGWTDMPPVLASIGNKSAITNNNLSFIVSAADAVDGDSIVLSASNLPAGAVFATVTNAGTVSNTFVWDNVGPVGVYTTTFWAVDNDGADSEAVVITIGDGSGPSEIVFQGFESTANDTWGIADVDPALVLNTTGSGDTPANQRIRTGSYSWQPGESEYTAETLELAEVDVSGYSDVVLTLHLSATATEADYGMWPQDSISFFLGLDGAGYSADPDLKVTGNMLEGDGISGVLWGYDATGVAATTAGVPRAVAPITGGISADGLATVQISVPPGTAALKFKADVAQEYAGYFWNVDDVSLAGIADGGATDYPPFIAVDPAGTNKLIAVSNVLSFSVTGREVPNDAADEVRLWATNLPSGATFPEVSGTSVLTNVFNWTPEATGTTVVSFFAGDKDGTNRVDVTITVFEQLPVGTYRAVICGISDYEGTENDLSYCDDDAQELYDRLLSGSNWSADNIQLLLDSQATEANIQAAIAAMGAASAPGDVNLFFFSGHGGGDLPDTDGDEGGDGYDEYMCPYNLTTQEITDDELSAWLDALPTDNLIVLLDTCFSGGHLKAPAGLTYKGISRTGAIVTNRTNGFVDDLRKKTRKDVDDLISPYIATACDETELSAEDSAIENGVFAYYLLEGLTNSDVNVDSWAAGEEAFDYLYPLVVAYNPEQHPQEYDGWPGLANIVSWAPLADQPPTIALNPAGTNKSTIIDVPLSFTVTATDSDGLDVALTVSGLPAGATAPDTNGTGTAATTFTWTPGAAQTGVYHVVFTATDDDGSTVRGVQITVRDGSVASDLFISEYVEGSSNNKYVEIFNGTGVAVDLSDYKLRLYANGSGTPSQDVALSGMLADGAVKVYQNSAAAIYVGENNSACAFNGDDAVALYKVSTDSLVDIFGCIGEDPGTAWTDGAHSTVNQTLVRKSTVFEGVSANPAGGFPTLASEWDTYAIDTAAYLGSHEFGAGTPTAPVLNPIGNKTVAPGSNLQFQVTATPTDSDAVTLTASNLPAGATFGATNENGTFEWLAASPTGTYSVSFYATDKDGTDTETIEISVTEAPPVDTNCTVIISEYVEGSSNNKAVEIFNPSADAIDLATGQYVVQVYANGNATPTATINLAGTLGAQDAFVLVCSTATNALLALADQTSGSLTFNGDDALVLRSGGASGTVLDSVGQVGVDPGTAWTNAGVSTLDQTLRRKASVKSGDLNTGDAFDPAAEWDGFAINTFDGLGSHTNECSGPALPTPPILNPVGNKTVDEGQNLEFPVVATPTDSDAVTLTASNLPAGAIFNATNQNGIFQWLGASPTGTYNVTFYATDKDGSDSETISITVGEAGAELLAPVIRAASAIDATQFNANWQASAGATGYWLDVATNELFRHTMGRRTATLAAGDLVIVTVNTDTNGTGKGFDAVPLVALDAGTVIYFTDNGWSNGVWRPGEGTVTYTAPGAVAAGTVLSYRSATANGFTSNANFNLSTGGDTILAYQGSSNSPSFLYGIGWAMATPWVAASTNSNNSGIPAGLSVETYTIVSCGSLDNYQYDAANGTSGSPGSLLQWVASAGNWVGSDASAYAKFTPDFTVGEVEQYNDFVPGYENRDVANVTTYAVTGLTEGVTYYYRVKAYNASSNSGYSAVTSVVTQASSGEPPDIAAFEVPAGATAAATLTTSTVGKTYKLQYTTNLMANPVVWTDADSEAGNGGELLLEDATPTDDRRYYRVTEN